MYSVTLLIALATFARLGGAVPLEQRGPGTAVVHNKCQFHVWLWSFDGIQAVPAHKLTPGAMFAESYRQGQNGGGISIKIARGDNPYTNPIEQLEYKVDSTLWYDLSEINGHPFADQKILLKPSRHTGSACVDVTSETAYQQPDDTATKACSLNTDLLLTLCA